MICGLAHIAVPLLTDASIASRSSREVPVYVSTKFAIPSGIDLSEITSVEKNGGHYCPVTADGTLVHNLDLAILTREDKAKKGFREVLLPLHSGSAWIKIDNSEQGSLDISDFERKLNSIAAIINGKATDTKGQVISTSKFSILFTPSIEEVEFK